MTQFDNPIWQNILRELTQRKGLPMAESNPNDELTPLEKMYYKNLSPERMAILAERRAKGSQLVDSVKQAQEAGMEPERKPLGLTPQIFAALADAISTHTDTQTNYLDNMVTEDRKHREGVRAHNRELTRDSILKQAEIQYGLSKDELDEVSKMLDEDESFVEEIRKDAYLKGYGKEFDMAFGGTKGTNREKAYQGLNMVGQKQKGAADLDEKKAIIGKIMETGYSAEGVNLEAMSTEELYKTLGQATLNKENRERQQRLDEMRERNSQEDRTLNRMQTQESRKLMGEMRAAITAQKANLMAELTGKDRKGKEVEQLSPDDIRDRFNGKLEEILPLLTAEDMESIQKFWDDTIEPLLTKWEAEEETRAAEELKKKETTSPYTDKPTEKNTLQIYKDGKIQYTQPAKFVKRVDAPTWKPGTFDLKR